MSFICHNCHLKIVIPANSREFNIIKQYLLCEKCVKGYQLYSKNNCKNIFLLNNDDLKGTKYVYIGNINNKRKYYLSDDIVKIVLKKYGSIEKLEGVKQDRKSVSDKTKNKKEIEMKKRRDELITAFKNNKLKIKNYGDCYSYIVNGTPSLDVVIERELGKLTVQNDRRIKLANKLSKLSIPLDESIKACYNYINNIGYKTLHETIRDIEMEHFFKTNTNYIELKKVYLDDGVARDIALKQYLEVSGNNISKDIPYSVIQLSDIKVDFD